jgi:hypothetical protein
MSSLVAASTTGQSAAAAAAVTSAEEDMPEKRKWECYKNDMKLQQKYSCSLLSNL